MTQTTEAACLLQSGTLYTRRLGLRPSPGGGDPIFAGFKRGAFSLYFGDEPIYHADLEGRWQRAFLRGTHYLKALDTSVVAIERIREGKDLVLRRRPLGFAEATDLDASVREMALDLIDGLTSGRLEPVVPPEPTRPIPADELREQLERISGWDAAAWFAHRERYLGTYGPPGFLPPEGQQAVLLQATLGHADGLTFGLAPPADHYVRSLVEFERHAREVADLLGRRLLQSRSVYLGGGDLLGRPPGEVASYLEATARAFPIEPGLARRRPIDLPDEEARLEGIVAFLDRFAPPLPDRDGWGLLRDRRLSRVVLGVESGDPEVRRLYGKHWEAGALRATVADAKAAGVGVSVVALVGAGGMEHADRHIAATAEFVNALALGPGDLVYLIDADEVGGESARRQLAEAGLTPVIGRARADQLADFKGRLAPVRTDRGAKVAPYSLDKQWM